MKMNLIKLITFIIILIILFLNIEGLFRYKFENADSASVKYQISDYAKDEIDILFLGPSKVMYDVSPIVIWNEINVSGFNLATGEQFPLVSYYLLKDSLEFIKPKIIFIEFRYMSTSTDPKDWPLSPAYYFGQYLIQNNQYKKEYIKDLKFYYPENDYTEYYFPFYRDHARWNFLSRNDFIKKVFPNYLLGGGLLDIVNSYTIDKNLYDSNESTIYYDEKSLIVYQKLVDLAKENDIKVIAFIPPTAITDKELYIAINTAKNFAEVNNISFYDFNSPELSDQLNLNPDEDFEIFVHLNVNGNYKFSVELANIISKINFESYDKHEDLIKKWNLMYSNYLDDIKKYKTYKLDLD